MRVVSVEASRASFADGSLLSWPQPCLRLLPCYLVVQLFWGWDESVSGAFRVASTQKPQSGRVWNHPLYDALCYYFWNIHIHFINDICQCLSHAKAFKRSPGVTAIETEPERFPLWRHLNQKVDPSQATWTHCSRCLPQQRHRDFLLRTVGSAQDRNWNKPVIYHHHHVTVGSHANAVWKYSFASVWKNGGCTHWNQRGSFE